MNGNSYLHRSCPICRNSKNLSIEVSSQTKGESLDYESLVPYWNGFFKEKIFFSYSRCSDCGLLYAPVFYQESQLGELYGQMAPNMDLVPMAALIKTQRGYFERLQRFSSLEGGYIEVGPDIGIFTKNCSRDGNFNKYWLCEPNKAVAGQLAAAVGEYPYQIIEDMFGFGMIPNNSVGVAVMIQVLDHLLDPVATLSELRDKLVPGAKLLLVTHNEQSLLRKVVGWRWPAFCLQHPQIYSPRSITALLEKSGYGVDSIERTTNYFEFSFLLKHLLWAFGIKVKSIPAIFNFTIGLKLGNIITIATPR
jgi:SAM-dependent methyltransferase